MKNVHRISSKQRVEHEIRRLAILKLSHLA